MVLTLGMLFKWKLNGWIASRISTDIPHELSIMLIVGSLLQYVNYSLTGVVPVTLENRPLSLSLPTFPTALEVVDAIAVFLYIAALHMKMVRSRVKHDSNGKHDFLCMSLISLLSCPFGALPVASFTNGCQVGTEIRNYSLVCNSISTIWMILAIYYGRPILGWIPMCVVVAMIFSELSNVYVQLKHLRMLCTSHAGDAVTSICALLSALIIPNLCIAFLVSVSCALLLISFKLQWPTHELLVRVGGNYFVEDKRYEGDVSETPLRILRLTSPVLYINCETVRREITKQAAIVKRQDEMGSRSPSLRGRALTMGSASLCGRANNNLIVITQDSDLPQEPCTESNAFRFVILDCCGIPYLDYEATTMLSQVYSQLRDDNIKLLFASVSASVRDYLEVSNFYSRVPRGHFFPTLQEARAAVRHMNFPFHTSVSMNGYRDVVTLSCAPSHQDVSIYSPEPV